MPIISHLLPPPLISFRHVSSPAASLTPRHLLSHPHSFGATTPVMCHILCAGLHVYSSGYSANPGGSTKGHPHPRGAELAGPSSIPRKQLLKWLVVVRHRLRHNGKDRRQIKGPSCCLRSCQKSDCIRRWCMIIQRLQAQIVRSHANAMCLMQHLDFVAVVFLSI